MTKRIDRIRRIEAKRPESQRVRFVGADADDPDVLEAVVAYVATMLDKPAPSA